MRLTGCGSFGQKQLSNSKRLKLAFLFVLLGCIGLGWFILAEEIEKPAVSLKSFYSSRFHLRLSYPSNYRAYTTMDRSPSRTGWRFLLLERKDHIRWWESLPPLETDVHLPSIKFFAYPNPKKLSLAEWARRYPIKSQFRGKFEWKRLGQHPVLSYSPTGPCYYHRILLAHNQQAMIILGSVRHCDQKDASMREDLEQIVFTLQFEKSPS